MISVLNVNLKRFLKPRRFVLLCFVSLCALSLMDPLKAEAVDLLEIQYYKNLNIIKDIAEEYLKSLNSENVLSPKHKTHTNKMFNRTKRHKKRVVKKQSLKKIIIYSDNYLTRRELCKVESCFDTTAEVSSTIKPLRLDMISLGLEPSDLGVDPFFDINNPSSHFRNYPFRTKKFRLLVGRVSF